MPRPKDPTSPASPNRARSPRPRSPHARSPRAVSPLAKSPRAVSPRKGQEADAPRPQRAFKYAYNARNETWARTECSVLVATKAFQEGGMRLCYKMYEIGMDDKYAPGVAKIFKPDVADDEEEMTKAYFDEAMTQTVADSFARQFNYCLPEEQKNLQCRFLPVHVLHLCDQGSMLCNIEPYLQGQYIKHNDNDGHVESDLELPQAFSHFTWECSNYKILVCDIQGVGNFYTDPQIHSHDGEGFGMGNIGQDGIDKFLETHKCNSICRMLGLGKPVKTKGQWTSGKRDKPVIPNTPSGGSNWSSHKYKGAMQQGLTKLKRSISKDNGIGHESDRLEELSLQQQKLLQQKLMLLVQQKGSLENQMLLSPKRAPMDRRNVKGSGERERDPGAGRLSSSFEWNGGPSEQNRQRIRGADFTCRHCGIVGVETAVSAHGRHHNAKCPRYRNQAPIHKIPNDAHGHGADLKGGWNSAEVQKLQVLLEAQALRIKGLDMGEVRRRCYAYDRP